MMNNDQLIVVGEYQINTSYKLGCGGFGRVYRALHNPTLTTVAVKQISMVNKDINKIKEIQNEIKLLKTLDHRRIVRYRDHGAKDGYLYIMMEYLESGSLGALTRKFKIDEIGISRYLAHVLEGLEYLHAEGIIHRDIKGDNVLLTKDGDVKLADFGVSAKLARVQSNEVVGTPYWMAPEIISLSGATYASDIWSLGCMIIELLTGKPPYYDLERASAFFKIVMDPHPPIPSEISTAAKDFLMCCFPKEPGLRKTASQLRKHHWITRTEVSVPISRQLTPMPFSNANLSVPSTRSAWDSFSSGSWQSDTWDTVVSSYETVIKKKNSTVIKREVRPTAPISNSDKLQAYHEIDDEDSSWGSDSDDESSLDLGNRLNFNITITNEHDSDELLFQDIHDFEIVAAQKLEEEMCALIRTISTDLPDQNLLDTMNHLQQRSDDNIGRPILIRALLSESMTTLISILDQSHSERVIFATLQLINNIIRKSDLLDDHLMLIGIFPAVMKTLHSSASIEVQEQIISLILQLIRDKTNTTRTFVASGGVHLIARLLKATRPFSHPRSKIVVYNAIDVLLEMLAQYRNQQKKDICRVFALLQLPLYLSTVISDMVMLCETEKESSDSVLPVLSSSEKLTSAAQSVDSYFDTVETTNSSRNDNIRTASSYVEKSLSIILLISACVNSLMINRMTIENIIRILKGIDSQKKLFTLHIIANICSLTDPALQETLIECGVLQTLILELSLVLKEKDVGDVEQVSSKSCVHILNALHMLCCYNNQRKELIAREGAISLLKDILVADLPMKNFALDLFIGFSISTNPETRREFMVKQGGLLGLFCILRTMNTRAVWPQMVLEALCELLSNNEAEQQKEYELMIAHEDHTQLLVDLFTNNNRDQAPWAVQMVPSLAHLLQVSNLVSEAFALSDRFIETLASWISKEVGSTDKADPIKLKALLEVLRICLEKRSDPAFTHHTKQIPIEASRAINELVEYTEQRKLAMLSIAQDLQKYFLSSASERS